MTQCKVINNGAKHAPEYVDALRRLIMATLNLTTKTIQNHADQIQMSYMMILQQKVWNVFSHIRTSTYFPT